MRILACILFALLLSGCQKDADTKIRLGFNTWVGYQAVVLAKEKGFFEAEGLNVELKEFPSLVEVKRAFKDKQLDAMFSSLYEVLTLRAEGEQLKIVLVADFSNGADALVVSDTIKTMEDLKQKKIGVELGSLSHYTVLKALKANSISEDDVKIVNMPVDRSEQAFIQGQVDAIGTWEPFITRALRGRGSSVFFTSRDIPNQILDSLSVREDIIKDRSRSVRKMLRAYLKAVDWLFHNREAAIEIMSRTSNVSVVEFAKTLEGVKICGLKENQIACESQEFSGSILPAVTDFIDFLYTQNLISQRLLASDVLDPSLLQILEKTDS